MNKLSITFTLNGKQVSVDVDPADRLLDTLRQLQPQAPPVAPPVNVPNPDHTA